MFLVELQTVMEQGRNIRRSGSGGRFERDFFEMEHKLEEIRHIIMTIDHNRPPSETTHLFNNLEEIRHVLYIELWKFYWILLFYLIRPLHLLYFWSRGASKYYETG